MGSVYLQSYITIHNEILEHFLKETLYPSKPLSRPSVSELAHSGPLI